MDLDTLGMAGGWLLLGLVTALIGLAAVAVWLVRKHQRQEHRAEVAEELKEAVGRLGLTTIWQAPLFQTDVYGIKGQVNELDVLGELWTKTDRDFFRLNIRFPRPARQAIRLVKSSRGGWMPMWKMKEVALGATDFDEAFTVYCPEGDEEGVGDLFVAQLRRRLVALGGKVDGLRLGDNGLFLYMEKDVEVPRLERIVNDSLILAGDLYRRAKELGPRRTGAHTTYDMAAVESTRRNGEDNSAGAVRGLPDGTSAGELDAIARAQQESTADQGGAEAEGSGGEGGGSAESGSS